jgi:hypothetical protein
VYREHSPCSSDQPPRPGNSCVSSRGPVSALRPDSNRAIQHVRQEPSLLDLPESGVYRALVRYRHCQRERRWRCRSRCASGHNSFQARISNPPPGRSQHASTLRVSITRAMTVTAPFSACARKLPFSAQISALPPRRSCIVNTGPGIRVADEIDCDRALFQARKPTLCSADQNAFTARASGAINDDRVPFTACARSNITVPSKIPPPGKSCVLISSRPRPRRA